MSKPTHDPDAKVQPPPRGGEFSTGPLSGRDLTKLAVLIGAYGGVVVAAQWVSCLLRFEFRPPLDQQLLLWRCVVWSVPLQLLILWGFGQYRSLLSYFSLPDVNRLVLACVTNGLVMLVVWYVTAGEHAPPRSIILLSVVLSAGGLIGLRMVFRHFRLRQGVAGGARMRRVAILGAGDAGALLAKEMLLRPNMGMNPIAFFDDDSGKWGARIHGIPVLGRPELLAANRIPVEEAIFAMPSATGRRMRDLVQLLNEARIRFETVPSLEQLLKGTVRVSQIRAVQIEDLLGREPVELFPAQVHELIRDKIVMVTGAGGSIGAELCRQIVSHNPRRLLLVERCEVQMFQIEQELLVAGCAAELLPLVADIMDTERMRAIFARFRPTLVFHAAAHKHVPLMEAQPAEAFRNNAIGTKLLAELAVEFAVERFVLISTDKAINPTSAMGATKRLAELYLQALQRRITAEPGGTREERPAAGTTRFMAVRFGNVLGSSGSVIPTFRRQIASGGPLTVTHPDITRYFMTVSEAVGLVLQSATLGEGGEIFVLDMGKPMRIVDLGRQLIELSGLRPDIDVEIKFTGLRPGEKLFEEINHQTENLLLTPHPKIMRFVGEPKLLGVIDGEFEKIQRGIATLDANHLKLEIQKLVPEYRPYLNC